MQTARFTLALLAFGVCALAVDRAVAWFPPALPDNAIAKSSTAEVVQPFAEVDGRPVLIGGIRILGQMDRSPLSPKQATDAAERAQAEKLNAWRAARARVALAGAGSIDELTTLMRIDTEDWSLAAVLRAPAGFAAADFSKSKALEQAEPTDDVIAFLATEQGTGTIVNTMRFDATEIGRSGGDHLPTAIARMQEQTPMLEMPPSESSAGYASLRLWNVDIDSAVARRMSALALESVKAEVGMRDANKVIIFAETPSWTATIIISSQDRGGPAMELVQYEPIEPGGRKP